MILKNYHFVKDILYWWGVNIWISENCVSWHLSLDRGWSSYHHKAEKTQHIFFENIAYMLYFHNCLKVIKYDILLSDSCHMMIIISTFRTLFHSTKVETNHPIIRVGNPDEWCTQNCLPQDCLPVGISEVGNPEGNLFCWLWLCLFDNNNKDSSTSSQLESRDRERPTHSAKAHSKVFRWLCLTVYNVHCS